MEPEISVVVPIYNVVTLMDRCLESLVHQSFSDIEIILIDDGSNDGSSEKCDSWASKDERIRVIHKVNAGVSSARNQGIQEATGKRIVFVDSDDWLDLETFSYVMGNYNKYDLVVWNYVDCINNEYKTAEFTYDVYVADTDNMLEVLRRYSFAGEDENGNSFDMGQKTIWNRMIKRSVIVENGLYFNENLKNHEDFLFVLMSLEYISNAVIVDKPFYYRLVRDGSASRSYIDNIYENNKMAFYCMRDYLIRFHNADSWFENSVKQYYTGWFIQILLMNYFHKDSKMSFWKAHKKTKSLLLENPYRNAFDYKLAHSSWKKRLLCYLGKEKKVFILSIIFEFLKSKN